VRYLLFHVDTSGWGRDYPWLDKWATIGKLEPVLIDPRVPFSGTRPMTFPDVASAQAYPELAASEWYFFDQNGTETLPALDFPSDQVVFAFGSDYAGWGGVNLEGACRVRIPGLPTTFAGICVPCLVYELIVREHH
jgi:hypothetical protein